MMFTIKRPYFNAILILCIVTFSSITIGLINKYKVDLSDQKDSNKKIEKIPVGEILNITLIPVSHSSPYTKIETTEGIFVVDKVISILKNKKTTIHGHVYDDTKYYLCIDGKKECLDILGYM